MSAALAALLPKPKRTRKKRTKRTTKPEPQVDRWWPQAYPADDTVDLGTRPGGIDAFPPWR